MYSEESFEPQTTGRIHHGPADPDFVGAFDHVIKRVSNIVDKDPFPAILVVEGLLSRSEKFRQAATLALIYMAQQCSKAGGARFKVVDGITSQAGTLLAKRKQELLAKARANGFKEPSEAEQRGRSRAAKRLATSVLDSYRLRDGRAIGDVRFHELPDIMAQNATEAEVIRLVLDFAPNAPQDAKVRDAISNKVLTHLIKKASGGADASR